MKTFEIVYSDEKEITDEFMEVAAQIKAELIFQNLMKLPPEIRIPLYRKIMDGYT